MTIIKNIPVAKAESSEDSFGKIEKEILAASHGRRPPPVSAALALSSAQPQGKIVVRDELDLDMPESQSPISQIAPPTISEGFA